MTVDQDALAEVIRLRVREQRLSNDLSEAAHLFYSTLLWVATQPETDFTRRALSFIRAKFFQMHQASRLGQMFVDLDKEFGNPLESNGVNLERWVFEPRETRHE